MSNFAFLSKPLQPVAVEAMKAESLVQADPRTAGMYARRALEAIVHWLYRHDRELRMPYDNALGALLHEPTFQNLVPEAVFQKCKLIQRSGNEAVHGSREVASGEALALVHELHHVCFWLMRTYQKAYPRDGAGWKDERVPAAPSEADVVPRAELEQLAAKLAAQAQAALAEQLKRDAVDAQFAELQAKYAELRAQAQAEPDTHDYGEAETRHRLIDVELRRAGWPLLDQRDREYRVTGMPNAKGVGYVDYVLWGDDGKPLAVVEAKKATAEPERGQQQAKLYADCLEQMHGQRPFIFYTNGYTHWFWDDRAYPARRVAGFHSKESLSRLLTRREQRQALSVRDIDGDIAGRYYQKRAIGSVFTQFEAQRRKGLLVMATGTGKTRTAIALVDALQRAGWVKRALFLADRTSLVNQACNAFKAQLPDASPVNLVTEKGTEGRVYVCTYPTMMGLIDHSKDQVARFGIGHFDLIVIDEAHRSVYRRYRQIFEYFDSLLLGLTATPREEIDRNTYDLFDLEDSVPTDAYELDTAVSDGFLVPPDVTQVDMRFPGAGITYDELSEDEKVAWEQTDWGDESEATPEHVGAPAINGWLFNTDTVDKVLQHLMEHGHHVAGGDRLGKTIVFARNHDHAVFIEERFNRHYPHLKGHFARVIDNRATYPQSLIDDFSEPDKAPHIAISVDMLDTGIDVPEVLNLVFFKPVYSKIKFWQMIGRGTRLCPDVFGPGRDKEDFRVFDFCFNFDFFREKPEGRGTSDSASLGTRLFRARVKLLGHLQADGVRDTETLLADEVTDQLHGEVAAMSADNFLVRLKLESVEPFQRRDRWSRLNDADRATLAGEVAGLPSALETDRIESRLFDLSALRLQLSLLEGDAALFEAHAERVREIAVLLEDKGNVDSVKAELAYLARVQEPEFWQDIDVLDLEELRVRLRPLVPLLDKRQRHLVYTSFQDEVMGVRPEAVIDLPSMTGVQYEKKVRDYLARHTDHLVIRRLRSNQPLTDTDLRGLERTLAEIGESDGPLLLSGLLERSGAPSLSWFVRSLVGMDRQAAHAAFAGFLSEGDLSAPQIRFVELIIDQLTARGVMEPDALYEAPFTDLHDGGPEAMFADSDKVVTGLFDTLRGLHTSLLPASMAG